MQVDCHMHSLCSDGVYTVKEIVEMLLRKNVKVFSLTDHDTVEGIKEARDLSKNKIRFISGIEFTCKEMRISPAGKTFSIHLLGYNFDEDNLQLRKALNQRKERVIDVYENLCGELTALGTFVLREEIPVSCGNVLQLCDVAAYIREKYTDVPEGIGKVIDSYAAKLNNVNISVEDAVKLIHGAGGKAVWAHPFIVYQDLKKTGINEKDVLDTLKTLSQMEVDGIEAYYLAFSEEQRKWLRFAAEKRNMIYTAGSDFHGSAGRDCMGINMGEDILERFVFRNIKKSEAGQAAAIEQICFPPNEACPEKNMADQIAVAGQLFLVAEEKETGKIAGYLNGIATDENCFRDEFFTDSSLHHPEGKNIMLLGLAVLPEYRGQGLGRELVCRYLGRERENRRREVVLTCLQPKVKMYEKFGFTDRGIADSAWGGEEWYEMSYTFAYEEDS